MTNREMNAIKGDRRLTSPLLPCLSACGVRNDWFDHALAKLKETANADEWHTYMYGA